MPRKNIRATKQRLDRRERGERRPKKPAGNYRPTIDQIVIPVGMCSFRLNKPKAIFATPAEAQEALDQARRTRGTGPHVEKRFYKCPEGGCGGYHLTSREFYTDRTISEDNEKGTNS